MRVYSAYRAAAGAVMANELGFDIDRAWVGGAESQFSAGRQSGIEVHEVQRDDLVEAAIEAAGRYVNSTLLDMNDDLDLEGLDDIGEVARGLVVNTFSNLYKWSEVLMVGRALLERGVLTGAEVILAAGEAYDV